MTELESLDQAVVDAALAALTTAMANARSAAFGTQLADDLATLTKARLIVTADGIRVRIALFAPNAAGEMLRLFSIDTVQETLQ